MHVYFIRKHHSCEMFMLGFYTIHTLSLIANLRPERQKIGKTWNNLIESDFILVS